MTLATLPDRFLGACQQDPEGRGIVGLILFGVGTFQFTGENPRTRYIEIGGVVALAGLCHPVASLDVQFMDRFSAIRRRVDPDIVEQAVHKATE